MVYTQIYFDGENATVATSMTKPCSHQGIKHTVTFLCWKYEFLSCIKCGKRIPDTQWKLVW